MEYNTYLKYVSMYFKYCYMLLFLSVGKIFLKFLCISIVYIKYICIFVV